ncbi:hypothetical protein mRhiFer1_009734 [Rhinolophus ferrumequinum]|uniref:Uncharacterized protein n=1 Tax=Rhinolophus ferrumequinum TaxID=59479 RepID=A0A7J7ZD69_RHIFE|nr:hypothetical protein mRhiFer1_009734 [Rhinolophus ferrumequinum]
MNLHTRQTVNQVYYLEVLKRVCEKDKNYLNFSPTIHGSCITTMHTALSVREFLASKQITVLGHLPYSPDLAPNDFFLYPKIKEILKGRHFDDIQDTKGNTMTALMAIPEKVFQKYFESGLGTGIGA